MRDALVRFLDALEAVETQHDELHDTDVREAMADVIEKHLVTGSENGEVPEEFLMFSPEGNRRVRDVAVSYLRRRCRSQTNCGSTKRRG
jgi:hypothetical protein